MLLYFERMWMASLIRWNQWRKDANLKILEASQCIQLKNQQDQNWSNFRNEDWKNSRHGHWCTRLDTLRIINWIYFEERRHTSDLHQLSKVEGNGDPKVVTDCAWTNVLTHQAGRRYYGQWTQIADIGQSKIAKTILTGQHLHLIKYFLAFHALLWIENGAMDASTSD